MAPQKKTQDWKEYKDSFIVKRPRGIHAKKLLLKSDVLEQMRILIIFISVQIFNFGSTKQEQYFQFGLLFYSPFLQD